MTTGDEMLTIEEIRERLADRRLSVVAEACGVHPETLRRLVKGNNVAYDTLKALSDYLEGKK
jgi:DNA-binding Xre family transcriptional regulator